MRHDYPSPDNSLNLTYFRDRRQILRTALGVPGGLVARIGSGSAGLPLAENRSHCSMPASVRVARGSTGMVNIDWPDSISNPYLIYNWQIGVGNDAVAAGITVQNHFSVSSVPESVERLSLMLIIGCPLSDGSVYIGSQMYELHIEPTVNPLPQEVKPSKSEEIASVCGTPEHLRIAADGNYINLRWPEPQSGNPPEYYELIYLSDVGVPLSVNTSGRSLTLPNYWSALESVEIRIRSHCGTDGDQKYWTEVYVRTLLREDREIVVDTTPSQTRRRLPRIAPAGYYYGYRINGGSYTSDRFTSTSSANLGDIGGPGDRIQFRVRTLCTQNPDLLSGYSYSATQSIPFPATNTSTRTPTNTPGPTPTHTNTPIPPPPAVTGVTVDCNVSSMSTRLDVNWTPSGNTHELWELLSYSVTGSDTLGNVYASETSGSPPEASTSFFVTGDAGFTATVYVQSHYGTPPSGPVVVSSMLSTAANCTRAPPTNTPIHTATNTPTPTPALPTVQNLMYACGNSGNDAVVTWTTDHFTTPAIAGFSGSWVVTSGDFSQIHDDPWPTPVETSPGNWQTSHNFATQFGLDPLTGIRSSSFSSTYSSTSLVGSSHPQRITAFRSTAPSGRQLRRRIPGPQRPPTHRGRPPPTHRGRPRPWAGPRRRTTSPSPAPSTPPTRSSPWNGTTPRKISNGFPSGPTASNSISPRGPTWSIRRSTLQPPSPTRRIRSPSPATTRSRSPDRSASNTETARRKSPSAPTAWSRSPPPAPGTRRPTRQRTLRPRPRPQSGLCPRCGTCCTRAGTTAATPSSPGPPTTSRPRPSPVSPAAGS